MLNLKVVVVCFVQSIIIIEWPGVVKIFKEFDYDQYVKVIIKKRSVRDSVKIIRKKKQM